jgi:hypothetical protein
VKRLPLAALPAREETHYELAAVKATAQVHASEHSQ